MGLNWASYRVAKEIIEKRFTGKEKITHNDMIVFLNEYLEYTVGMDMEINKAKTKKTGTDNFQKFVEYCLFRNLANFDSMILLTSDKGTGKSSFALMLAYEWCKLLGIKFDPDRHFAYTNAQVMDRIRNLNSFEPLVCLQEDTEVLIKEKNNNVRNKKIKDLVGRNDFQVKSYDLENDKFEWVKPDACVYNGMSDDLYEIELIDGNKIKATGNHKFYTKNGIKKLSELTEDDELMTYYINMKTIKIKSIKKLSGKHKVYDIVNSGKDHNFIINNYVIVHNCDESINFITSESWSKSENKELKKVLGQVRTKHLFYVLCFPLKIMKVDKIYLESYVNYWIDLYERGKGALFVKDKNPYFDAWRMKEFQKLGNYNEFTSPRIIKEVLMKHPNFWQLIRCRKPRDALYNRYLKVREFNVYNDQNVLASTTKEDMIRALLIITLKEILQRDSSLSIKRLLLHLENTYKLKIERSVYDYIIKDATMLAEKLKLENIEK